MINFTSVVYDNGAWVFTWASGLGTVRVVLWGEELATTDECTYTYTSALWATRTDAPPLEVVLEGTLAVSEIDVCFVTLQWYRVECDHYLVEYKSGANWLEVGTITDSALIPVQTFRSPVLDDQETTEWRVTAVDENKRTGTPLPYQWKTVRPPDPPTGWEIGCAAGTLSIS